MARWLAIAGVVVVTAVGIAWLAGDRGTGIVVDTPNPSAAAVPSASSVSTALPSSAPSATASPTPRAAPTARPIATGDPRLLYAEFLLRLGDDRIDRRGLNQDAPDRGRGRRPARRPPSVHRHPRLRRRGARLAAGPSARGLLCGRACVRRQDARCLRRTADAFIAWADAGDGLVGLAALGRALEAAGIAGRCRHQLGRELEATTCLT